ncbi:MAG: hypothetical protein V1827_04265 [Candidatus Micrarchaeota archaeon]
MKTLKSGQAPSNADGGAGGSRRGRFMNRLIEGAPAMAVFGALFVGVSTCAYLYKQDVGTWKGKIPMCEGPRVYKLESGGWEDGAFRPKETLHMKKGDKVDYKGKTYVVVGALSEETGGALIIREEGTENHLLIGSKNHLNRFKDKLRFDGWTCENPKTAKSE